MSYYSQTTTVGQRQTDRYDRYDRRTIHTICILLCSMYLLYLYVQSFYIYLILKLPDHRLTNQFMQCSTSYEFIISSNFYIYFIHNYQVQIVQLYPIGTKKLVYNNIVIFRLITSLLLPKQLIIIMKKKIVILQEVDKMNFIHFTKMSKKCPYIGSIVVKKCHFN